MDGGGDRAGFDGGRSGPPLPSDTATDGPTGEGAFLACSFWYVDVLAGPGAARGGGMFARLLGLSNDVGLLAEEYDPVAGGSGEFPAGVFASGADQFGVEAGPRGGVMWGDGCWGATEIQIIAE